MSDLTQVATELYGLPPTEFTAARAAAVRALRLAGVRALARAVGSLRRPTTAAAVNLLVRHRPADVGRLLELGARLREAQAALAGTDLRTLHAEQHRVMVEVVGEAIDLVSADGRAGPAVRGQVEGTLRAAMGDPDAAVAVRTGLLIRDLFSSGFEPVDVAGAVAVPDAPPLVGAPARPTPLRAVPSPDERARAGGRDGGTGESGKAGESADASESGDEVRTPGRGGRRRGRLITSDDPERPGRLEHLGRTSSAAAERRRPEAGGASGVSRGGGAAAPGQGEGGTVVASRVASRVVPREASRQAEREAPPLAEREAARQAAREPARRQATEDVALAEQDAAARAAERDAADERLNTAETRIAELTEVIERTEQEIAGLREVLARAQQDARDERLEVRHARSARATATRAADRAEQRAREARDHRDRL